MYVNIKYGQIFYSFEQENHSNINLLPVGFEIAGVFFPILG